MIRTGTLEELFDVATLLAHQPVPRGRRVGILTNAGGPGILAADACEAQGLELPALVPDDRRAAARVPPGRGERRATRSTCSRRRRRSTTGRRRADPARRRGTRQPPRDLHPADRDRTPRRSPRADRRRRRRRAKARARDLHEREGRAAGPRADPLLSLSRVGGDRARARRRLRRVAAAAAGKIPALTGLDVARARAHRRPRARARRRLARPR